MRLKPSICAFLVMCWAFTSAISAHAQESQEGKMPGPSEEMTGGVKTDPDPADPDKNAKSHSTITSGGGTAKEFSRDSIQNKVVKPFKIIEKHDKEDEDPLSFNFLYYIIEKFKLSDIIE